MVWFYGADIDLNTEDNVFILAAVICGKIIMKKEHKTIGWREFLSLPKLGVESVKAKIDTGARTSSLHVSEISFYKRKDKEFAHFTIHPKQKSALPAIEAKAEVVERRKITSSNGHASLRPVIVTEMVVGDQRRLIELTLVNRDMMGFRMLLGREALRGEYIVDPGRSYLQSRELQRKSQKEKLKASKAMKKNNLKAKRSQR